MIFASNTGSPSLALRFSRDFSKLLYLFSRRYRKKTGQGGASNRDRPDWIQWITCGLVLIAASDDLWGVWQPRQAQACGIVAFVADGGDTHPLEVLLDGLRILQNRGYDSVGIATLAPTVQEEERKEVSETTPALETSSENKAATEQAQTKAGKGTGPLDLLITKVVSSPETPATDCVELLEAELRRQENGRHLEQRHKRATCGIAHTRWATHGARTQANAHPHSDWKDRIALVHNGTIENFDTLKAMLEQRDVPFRSETDSEVIANLIGLHLDEGKDVSLLEAVKKTVSMLNGTWALTIISSDNPNQLVAATSGCPLVVARVPNVGVFVASEPSAFACHVAAYASRPGQQEPAECFQLVDGAVVVLDASRSLATQIDVSLRGPDLVPLAMQLAMDMGFSTASNKSPLAQHPQGLPGLNVSHQPSASPTISSLTSPTPYPHWTIREISEQPEALLRAITAEDRIPCKELASATTVRLDLLDESGASLYPYHQHIVLTACGTSLYACEFSAHLLRKARVFRTVQVVDAAEFTTEILPGQGWDGNPVSGERTLVCVVSQSGETKDTHRAAVLAKTRDDVTLLGVVNQRGSLIARLCGDNRVLYTEAGKEWAVASTKAFTTQCAVFAMLAVWFLQQQEATEGTPSRRSALDRLELLGAIKALPNAAQSALQEHDALKTLAAKLKRSEHMFVLGRGMCEAIAREGALKIKEITYIHAEGCSGGSLKHGPFALLSPGTPVVLLVPRDINFELMIVTAQEVKARGALTIIITDVPNEIPEVS